MQWGRGKGWGGRVVITAWKCCEWCDLLWCENVKIKVLTLNFLFCCVKGWYRPYVVMQYGCMNEWRILVYLFAFILYFPMTKWRSFILFKINYYLLLLLIIINYYLLLKTLEITNSSCKLNQKNIGRAPADQQAGHPTVNGRWSGDSFSSGGDRLDPRQSPDNGLTMAAGASAENFGQSARKSGGGRTVSRRRWSCGRWMVYDIVQGQENRPMSYDLEK